MQRLKGFNVLNKVPSYLSQYSELWLQNPHTANLFLESLQFQFMRKVKLKKIILIL